MRDSGRITGRSEVIPQADLFARSAPEPANSSVMGNETSLELSIPLGSRVTGPGLHLLESPQAMHLGSCELGPTALSEPSYYCRYALFPLL
jgi:hypothetical protein